VGNKESMEAQGVGRRNSNSVRIKEAWRAGGRRNSNLTFYYKSFVA